MCCVSYESFVSEMRKVFDHPLHGRKANQCHLTLKLGTRTVAEFPVEFRKVAADSGWNNQALQGVFLNGLSEQVRDDLAVREDIQLRKQWRGKIAHQEEVFMSYTVAYHQGAIERFWLYFSGDLLSFIVLCNSHDNLCLLNNNLCSLNSETKSTIRFQSFKSKLPSDYLTHSPSFIPRLSSVTQSVPSSSAPNSSIPSNKEPMQLDKAHLTTVEYQRGVLAGEYSYCGQKARFFSCTSPSGKIFVSSSGDCGESHHNQLCLT